MIERTRRPQPPTHAPENRTPPPVVAATQHAFTLAALRHAVQMSTDGIPAVRAERRVAELRDALTDASARITAETGIAGTAAELLADAHLRAMLHHMHAYVSAATVDGTVGGLPVADPRALAVALVHGLAHSVGGDE